MNSLKSIGIAAALYATVGGVVSLLGWLLNAPVLTDWDSDGIAMLPNTTVAAVLCGVAVLALLLEPWLQPRRHRPAMWIVRCSAGLAAAIGGLTLLEHLTGWTLGIDTLFIDPKWGERAAAAPGRIGPPASLCYLLLGTGLLLATADQRSRWRGMSALLALGAALPPIVSLTAYLYAADPLYSVPHITGIAQQTGTILLALAVALMTAVPEHGLGSWLSRPDAAGTLMRRLLPISLILLILTGWLEEMGIRSGLYDRPFGIASLTVVRIFIFIALLWWTARAVGQQVKRRSTVEQALRIGEERYRAIVESQTEMVCRFRPDGMILFANGAYARSRGCAPEELIGRTFWDFVDKLDRAHVQAMLDQLRPEAPELRIENRFQGASGTRWMLWTNRALSFDSDGRAGEVQSSGIDITDRKQAEERLQEESRTTEVLNRIGQLIAAELNQEKLVQAVTDEATKLTEAQFGALFYNVVSDQGESYWLYTIAGVPRNKFERFPMPRNTAIFEPTFRGHGPVRMNDVTKDPRYGKNLPYKGMPQGHLPVKSYLAVPVVSRSGEVLGGLFFGHERPGVFTQRHEKLAVGVAAQAAVAIDNARLYRQAQEQAQQLREANRMKDEFLATLSHELRTPMTAILGWAQMLRKITPDQSLNTHANLPQGLEVIERNARLQSQIIEDLLDMSRIISGKVRLDIQTVHLSDVVQAAIDAVRPAAEAKGVQLQSVCDQSVRELRGDPSRLQQAFYNLLANAVKFTPKEGRVQVVCQRVNSHVEVSVSDTGIGIASEFLPHVFERFRQQDASTTRSFGGLGLGLAIVKHLIELHGGSVDVASEGPGKGATFTVRLPLSIVVLPSPEVRVDGSDRLHPTAPPPGEPGGRGASQSKPHVDIAAALPGITVMIVDDEPDARDLLRRMLESHGVKAIVAASATQALESLALHRPNILLCDIGMPGADGYSLISSVRELPAEQGGTTPAIALTAFARSEDRTRSLRAGFQLHLAKPVEIAELLASIVNLAAPKAAAHGSMNWSG